MGAFVFGLVVVGVVLAIVFRPSTKEKELEQARNHRETLEGHHPDEAWMIQRDEQIDVYVRRERCHCGGKVWKRASSEPPDLRGVRVVVCECTRCEEVIRLYFEREYLN
jgi:hypothetical protein